MSNSVSTQSELGADFVVNNLGRLDTRQEKCTRRSEPDAPWEPLIGYGDGSYTAS